MRDRAILCLVTDRRRLAARLSCTLEGVGDYLIAQVGAAAEAGVDIVHIREADLPAAALAALTRRIVARLGGTATRVVVSDRVDVALVTGADGVHLKAASIAPSQARALAPPGWLIGASVHDRAGVRPGADYLIAGTVRATASKPEGTPLLGFDGLHEIARAVLPVPVLGIGGLSADDIRALRRAGAAGLAGIDVFLPDGPAGQLAENVHRAVTRLRLGFDSSGHVP
jgi:thiamine-phosphate pyrophosphorylase